ncbi:MAG: DUF885 domain-containing protein [Gammaproteobacteria bacterium]|nr:DUF885 domain-containing protein [Gammaproteobacteria bacterium]
MIRVLKWGGGLVGLALLVLVVLVLQAVYFRPLSISVFYEKAFIEFALKSPETLSAIRLFDAIGLHGHNAELDDISPAQTEEFGRKMRENLDVLHEYDRDKLSGQKAMSYDILDWWLGHQVAGQRFTWHGYPVNQLFGVQSNLPDFMANIHHLGELRDAEHYIARLSKFDTKFEQLLEDLAVREQKEILPPQFVITKVLEEMRNFVAQPAAENILYTSFAERIADLDSIDSDTRDDLEQQVMAEIDATVYPAYNSLIDYFERLDNKVSESHGVWALPDGEAYYDHQLKSHTTTDYDAEHIHRVGLAEVERIEAEMDAILRSQGYDEGSVAERVLQLNEEPRFLYPNTDDGREQILADYTAIIDEASELMPQYFGRLPLAPVEVKRVPEFKEETSPGAYYQGPSLDGERAGVFYVNLRDLNELPTYSMRTLSYHEAVPGHHFQTALQTEMKGVPQFRKLLGFTAFSEGWALYTERLAWEIGLHEDPYDNLGRLRDEMMRAVRLVVDTGIHAKRWTREQAIDYMLSKTGMVESDVVTEIERYFVLPGQATAYKVGMIKILELRERAQSKLGEQFDIRAFHDVVLGLGDVPLNILEREVDNWIDTTLQST